MVAQIMAISNITGTFSSKALMFKVQEYQFLISYLLLTEIALIATRNNATIAVLCLPHFNAGTAKKFVPIK